MYAFSKVCKVSGLTSTKKKPDRERKKLYTPNETILLEECDYNILDPFSIERWLKNWRELLTRAVNSSLHPMPCSDLIRTAKTELRQISKAQVEHANKILYYDPHTLQITNPHSLHNSSEKVKHPHLLSSGSLKTEASKVSQPITATLSSDTPDQLSSQGKSILGKLQDIRRRKPMEEIQQLYSHVAKISKNCAQAYVRCQNLHEETVPSHTSTTAAELEPDALLLNVLAHQVGGLDVSLSASMDKSCKLFLEGMQEIIETIDFVCDVRNAFYKPLPDEKLEELRKQTTPIVRLLDKVNTLIAFDTDVKYYLIKLQMEALLVITWPLGSSNFANYLKATKSTVATVLRITEDITPEVFQSLDWETQDDFLRDQYFKIMEEFYFQKRRFANRYDSEMLHKLNYHAEWLNHIQCKYSTTSKRKQSKFSKHKPSRSEDANGDSSKKKDDEDVKKNIPTDDAGPGTNNFSTKYQRYRDSNDLIVQLTNHLLHINNCRTKFMRRAIIKDWESKNTGCSVKSYINNSDVLSQKESCEILVSILRHQIAGLDIALSSDIFNSIKCFLHGLYDTSCSIMSIMSDKYYDQQSHDYLPLPPGFEINEGGGGDHEPINNKDTNVARILNLLQYCNGIIQQMKPKWKHTLLKLQLEALILTQLPPESDLFRKHIELMAGTAENAYYILNQQWFIPYLSISWDNATGEDRKVFHDYWQLLPQCLEHEDM